MSHSCGLCQSIGGICENCKMEKAMDLDLDDSQSVEATCPDCAKLTKGRCTPCFQKLQAKVANGGRGRSKSPLINSAERQPKVLKA